MRADTKPKARRNARPKEGFYLLDVLCPIQENITVYKVSSKIFDLDFDRPKCNWINQVLGFSKFVSHFIVYFL